MGRRPKKYQPFVSTEDRFERVKNMIPECGYKIPEIISSTGWSATSIYTMMKNNVLPFYVQGAHRRVLGKHVKSVFLTKV